MNGRSFIPTLSDFEQEFIFEVPGSGLSAPGTSATVSQPCPQKAGTATDRCSSPRPCPAIPDLRCVTRVSGIPFHYVAGVGRDAATRLRRVTKRQEGRTQRMVPRAIAALEAFVRNARAFGLPFDVILTMGSLYCRCIRNSNPPALSNHSFGDAIDVAGVRWAASGGPASRVRETIVHNFRDPEQRALLRRLNACLRLSFATVIDYHRADHQDHFHCDTNQGRGRFTRGSATLRFVQEALGAVLGRTVKITGKLDAATKKALLDYSKKGPEIFKSNLQLNEVFDRLFRQVASGKAS
jgi:extensin-like protein